MVWGLCIGRSLVIGSGCKHTDQITKERPIHSMPHADASSLLESALMAKRSEVGCSTSTTVVRSIS